MYVACARILKLKTCFVTKNIEGVRLYITRKNDQNVKWNYIEEIFEMWEKCTHPSTDGKKFVIF